MGDCSQLWPTTTTTTQMPGCCYGDSEASNAMCAAFDDDADKCDARGQCEFREGEDADCTYTPTTTTSEVGCCKGVSRNNADMCAGKDSNQCGRSNKCEFIVTTDFSECEYPTTTSEPRLKQALQLEAEGRQLAPAGGDALRRRDDGGTGDADAGVALDGAALCPGCAGPAAGVQVSGGPQRRL